MTDLENHLKEIQNSSTKIKIGNFQFAPNGPTYQVIYKDHPLVQEEITKETLNQYEKVAQHFNVWKEGKDLSKINNWTNLYGEPYWIHKGHSLQFRLSGVRNGPRYEKQQIRSPEYFNPDCLKRYHPSKESAVLTMLLTLIRYEPSEVAYQHHYQRSIIKQLQEIHGIGEKIAQDLYDLGVRDYPDIKEHKHKLETVYKKDTLKEVNEKIEQGTKLIQETEFLDNYGDQHIANII